LSATNFEAFLANLGKKGGGGVVAAVDLAKIGSNIPIYDLRDPDIIAKLLKAYPSKPNMFRVLGPEGVIAVGGKVPARAVQSLVKIPPGISDAERLALLEAVMKPCGE